MRHVDIKWLPETFAAVALTNVSARKASNGCEGAAHVREWSTPSMPIRLIVISDGSELRAAVTTAVP